MFGREGGPYTSKKAEKLLTHTKTLTRTKTLKTPTIPTNSENINQGALKNCQYHFQAQE